MSVLEEVKERAERYSALTEKALEIVEISAEKNSKERVVAEDFLDMARNYLSDGRYYAEKGDWVTALASFSYAHAWIDAGVRARILKGEGNELFVQPE